MLAFAHLCLTHRSMTSTASPAATPATLYQRVMGVDFDLLSSPVARFHRLAGAQVLHGQVQVQAPASLLGRVLAWGLGAPQQAGQGAIRFELDATPGAEVWTRIFPTRTMRSTLREAPGFVEEHMGAARLLFGLTAVEGGRLEMRLVRMRFLGIPCPRWLQPAIVARETGQGDDQLHFDVQATVPWIGRVVAYRGHLQVPADAKCA